MEVILYNPTKNGNTVTNALTVVHNNATPASTTKPFIEANTIECTLSELRQHHIIPVFTKDNGGLFLQGKQQLFFQQNTEQARVSAFLRDLQSTKYNRSRFRPFYLR
jgi:hypothetical protein